jgi:flagellar biosynthesis/type III secretory pathway M-ring protein FliF/YscJ
VRRFTTNSNKATTKQNAYSWWYLLVLVFFVTIVVIVVVVVVVNLTHLENKTAQPQNAKQRNLITKQLKQQTTKQS